MKQRTISSAFEIQGKGLHSGKPVRIRVEGAPEDSGILFERKDLSGTPILRAEVSNVVDVKRCTVLGNERFRISTVEHFLAAAYGLGLNNLKVTIDSEEMPATDGSSKVFCEYFLKAGIEEQGREIERWMPSAPLFVKEGNAVVIALPSDELKITSIFESSHSMVPTQIFESAIEPESFITELAPARTFCFWEEVKGLWECNLGIGGDYDNALVIMPDGFSTPLRFANEIARHKCLDLLGDVALFRKCLGVHLISVRAGHLLNIQLLKIFDSLEVRDVRNKGD